LLSAKFLIVDWLLICEVEDPRDKDEDGTFCGLKIEVLFAGGVLVVVVDEDL
jgi:hypothetical protein